MDIITSNEQMEEVLETKKPKKNRKVFKRRKSWRKTRLGGVKEFRTGESKWLE